MIVSKFVLIQASCLFDFQCYTQPVYNDHLSITLFSLFSEYGSYTLRKERQLEKHFFFSDGGSRPLAKPNTAKYVYYKHSTVLERAHRILWSHIWWPTLIEQLIIN